MTGSQERKNILEKRHGVSTYAEILQKKYASRIPNDSKENTTNTGNHANEHMRVNITYDVNNKSGNNKKQKREPKIAEIQQKNIDNIETNSLLKRLQKMEKKQEKILLVKTKLEQIREEMHKREIEKAIQEESNTNKK